MDITFVPTEEQAMLREGLRRWGAALDPRETGNAEAFWEYGAGQGWLMAGLPEEAGGLGGSAFDSAIIAEELGRALVRAPFVEIGMVSARVMLAVSLERAAQLASGEARPLFAHDEPGMRGDPSAVRTCASHDGSRWRLSGRKSGVVGAPFAEAFLVSALLPDGGTGLFEVAPSDAGLRPGQSIDGRPFGDLWLENASAAQLLEPADAEPVIADAFDHALVLESAEAIGAMERVLELTRDYLQTRKQYGQLIGDFQVLRHRLADMFIEIEQARSLVLRGLAMLDGSSPSRERARMSCAVRARAAWAAQYVAAQGVQLHGGIGVTDEYPIGHYFKRLLAFVQRHGGEARMVERFAVLSAAAT